MQVPSSFSEWMSQSLHDNINQSLGTINNVGQNNDFAVIQCGAKNELAWDFNKNDLYGQDWLSVRNKTFRSLQRKVMELLPHKHYTRKYFENCFNLKKHNRISSTCGDMCVVIGEMF